MPLVDTHQIRIRETRARHYRKYAERYKAQSKAWRLANPDKVKASNDKKPRKTDRRTKVIT